VVTNLLASLQSSATTLEALQRSVGAVQNNVSNASTPGYVRQRMSLSALDFDPERGLTGGVTTAGLASARNQFAEAAVRSQTSILGAAEESRTLLSWVETALNLNDASGVPTALDRFYSAATSWSLSPNSLTEKENVFAAANALAASFNRTADSLQHSATEAQDLIRTTLDGIDSIAERIRLYNSERMQGRADDAGAEAKLHADLEELAGLMNFQALWREDGTVTILVGGRSAVVSGAHRYSLSVSFNSREASAADPQLKPAIVRDGDGNDITEWISEGKTGALLSFLNKTVPGYIGGPDGNGQLNELAEKVAARVSAILAAGYPPLQGQYQFLIYGSSPVAIAQAIRVNPAILPGILNATDPNKIPPVVNGKAQQLAALARPSAPEDTIDGTSYVGFFGRLSAQAGRDVAAAKQEVESRQQLVAQARSLRQEVSGVSLDEEAIRLVEFQRAYQATARMVTALSEITEMAVNLGRV
jgi:flagellar hook-associated protein 1 FlgK